jgi:hypothetical protein
MIGPTATIDRQEAQKASSMAAYFTPPLEASSSGAIHLTPNTHSSSQFLGS